MNIGNVHTIHGAVVLDENGADPDVVCMLEEFLVEAKRGEIKAMACAAIHRNDEIHTKAEGVRSRHLMVAACSYLQHDLMALDD